MTMHVRTALFCLIVVAPAAADDPPFPAIEPAAAGIDAAALAKLKARSEATQSDAVVILRDGKVVADWDFGKPSRLIEAMSATKSVVSLAIGRLIDQGKIRGLDQPVADFYPEWKQGRKGRITIRHLLNHTSGLQNVMSAATEINPSPDIIQLALAAELRDDPGSMFLYNNKAVNLLAGIVAKASGVRMDIYLATEVFTPLGIKDHHWQLDRAGNPLGMSGLQIRAMDFARIGQMMLDEGTWKGQRIVSKEWVRVSTRPSQTFEPRCGLLWWMVPASTEAPPEGGPWFEMDDAFAAELAKLGLTGASMKRVEAMKGKSMPRDQFYPAIGAIFRLDEAAKEKIPELLARLNAGTLMAKMVTPPPARAPALPPVGFSAEGYIGQYLVVIPAKRIVAVRQRQRPMNYRDDGSLDSFGDFPRLVRALVP